MVMEYIRAILYRKLNPSDFKKMYDIDKPKTGGGQTYIDATGISQEEFLKFSSGGRIIASTYVGDNRPSFLIEVSVLGNTNINKEIKFEPRHNRKNYKISRQNLLNKHPAWSPDNNFPVPDIDNDPDFTAVTKNLTIYIVKTSNNSYYASFIDVDCLPTNWPTNIGLEKMFNGDRRGVLFFEQDVPFQNSSDCPFVFDELVASDNVDGIDISKIVEDKIEYIDTDVEFSIPQNISDIVKETDPPKKSTIKNSSKPRKYRPIKKDYIRSNRNKKLAGDAGEEIVLIIEKEKLKNIKRYDLAEKVSWCSKDFGDGLGYDILSYEIDSQGNEKEIYIEVKTTTGSIHKPFEVSINEVNFSLENSDSFYIYRVYSLNKTCSNVKYYKVAGAIPDNFELYPTNFIAKDKL